MAEINTVIAEASQDLQTIEDFVNLPAGSDVRPRLLPSVNVGTLSGIRDAIFEAGGLPATPFPTLTNLESSALPNGSYGMVTDSTDEVNGLYVKTGDTWSKSNYDPASTAVKKSKSIFKTKALMEASNLPDGSDAAVTDSTDDANGFYKKEGGVWVKAAFDPYLFSKNTSNGLFLGRPKGIQVDTIAKTITFDGRISRNKQSYNVSFKSVTYDPADIGVKAFVYSPSTGDISIVHGGIHATNLDDGFIFGTTTNFNNKPYLEGFGNYYVDGVLNSEPRYKDVSMVMNDAAAIDFRFAENKIVLDSTIWIPYNNYRIYIAPRTITLASSRTKSARNLLIYDTLTFTVFNIEADLNYKIDAHQVVICGYKEDTKTIYGLDVYMVDGVSSEEFKKRNGALHLPLFEDGALNFDFANHEITLSTEMWIPMPAGRIKIEPQTVQLDPTRNKNIAFRDVLLVNLDDMSLVVKQAITNFKMPPNHILIGAYHERDGKLWNLDRAKINGMSPKSDVGASISHVAYGYDTKKVPNLNVPDSFTDSDVIKLTSVNSGRVNGWYDQLMSEHPEYITREILGTDASGTLPIYCYTFKPPRYKKQGGSYAGRPKIMIQALHNERINHIYPYLLMREICNNWQTNEHLEGLRWGVEFKVIPVLNPWGLDNGSRTNSNGVDINRNYPHGWKLQTEIPATNSGPEPLSESEAQASYNLMTTYKPHIIVDCHSFGAFKDYGRSAWLTSLSDADNEIISNAILPFYSNYAKRYEWLEPFNNLFEVHDIRSKQGTASDARVSLGILGGTFETSWNLRGSPDAEIPGHNIAINFNVDLFLYFIVKNLEYLNAKGMI